MPTPVIQVRPKQTLIFPSKEGIEFLQKEFKRKHCLLFPKFLPAMLVKEVQAQIFSGKYYSKHHGGLAAELCMRESAVTRLIQFFINDERIFKFVEEVTGIKPIGCFHGRVYRMEPGKGHYHKWHSDWVYNRIIGVSINLSPGVYRGGALEMRHFKSKKTFHTVYNTGFGDMILFRLGAHLEHRVTDVEGNIPKVAFAGWFSTRPKYLTCLKSTVRANRRKPKKSQKK
jgi:hypothetical protein